MSPKNCPFCGTPIYQKQGHADITFFLCLPTEGGCGAVISFAPHKMGDKAVEAFNRRPTSSGLVSPTTGETK